MVRRLSRPSSRGVEDERRKGESSRLGWEWFHESTGGKQKLLGIRKRGNRYLRKLFVQCARAVLQQKTKQSPGLKAWLEKLTSRTPATWLA